MITWMFFECVTPESQNDAFANTNSHAKYEDKPLYFSETG
jgi:hypothetical protein